LAYQLFGMIETVIKILQFKYGSEKINHKSVDIYVPFIIGACQFSINRQDMNQAIFYEELLINYTDKSQDAQLKGIVKM